MNCPHTGLPRAFCGHCNGTSPIEREPFNGRRLDDDTPRLVKMRGKAEWRGRGQNIDTFERGQYHDITKDTRVKGSCTQPVGFSPWSRSNSLRTLCDVAARMEK